LEENLNAVGETKTAKFRTFNHFIMNLPATAIEFLDAFKGLYKDKESLVENPLVDLPMIHCHCFSKSEKPETELIERISSTITSYLDEFKIHFVRKVAPNKDMLCVSFRLSQEVAFNNESTKSNDKDDIDTLPHKNDEVNVVEKSNEQNKRRKTEEEDLRFLYNMLT